MATEHINRRTFLKATALAAAAAMVQACAPAEPTSAPAPTKAPAAPTNTSAPAATATPEKMTFKEAPMLADLVKAGKLPPVEQRLPPSPQVLTPLTEVGTYGGTLRTAINNVNSLFGDPQAVIGTELVLRIDKDFSTIIGGLFESWEFNSNATEQVLHLRKGLRWSDGEPFTTQDCLFDYIDCKGNKELSPAGPSSAWKVGKAMTPMTMEAPDDYTLKLGFAEPYPLITLRQCFYSGCQYGGMFAPKHYGKQFHPAYADAAALDKLVKDNKFETWMQLMGAKMLVGSTIPAAVGLPGMTAFIRTADDPDHHTYERNPYYWKVDTSGQQLPYWDKVIVYIIADKELLTTRLVSGELDLIGHSAYLKNMELYQKSLDAQKLKIYMWKSTLPSAVLIYPQHTCKDKELREFFQKKDVRVALSISMNRDEINDVVHFGLGEVRQWAMWPDSAYYRPGDESHYVEYDPKQANELLDKAGYDKKDAEGYRLLPSGKRLGWLIEYDPEQGDIPPTLELCIQYWKAIGIELTIKPLNRSLLNERFNANDLIMTTWQGDISDIVWPQNPRAVICGLSNHTWARAWEAWLWTKDRFPDIEEEPPQWLKDQFDDWMAFQVELNADKRMEIARKIWDRYYEELPCFGTVAIPQPVVMKANITNFPEMGAWGYSCIRAVPVNPETFFFKS
ncbi:MAG: ABC transporter substrate-binding protein [Chloroflexi bacterium]|nr:ABC transporter substrate-binding protein [Chloroflexota bacterium]